MSIIIHTDETKRFAKYLQVPAAGRPSFFAEFFLEEVLSVTAEFGLVKFVVCKINRRRLLKGWQGVDLKQYKPCDFVDSNFVAQIDEYIKRIDQNIPEYDLLKECESERQRNHKKEVLANGHDVIELMVKALEPFCYTRFKNNPEMLKAAILGAFQISCFKNMSLYDKLREWGISRNREIVPN